MVNKQKTFLALLLALMPLISYAQTALSEKFRMSYSGRLVTSTGAAVQGEVQLEVRFYDVASGGMALGGSPYSFSNVKLSEGVFSIEILIEDNDINAIFPSVSNKTWIEISDVTNSQTYPRQIFNVVPYALKIPVDESQFSYATNGKLALDDVPMTRIIGLSDALAVKVDNVPATSSTSGILSAADWTRFDAKQAPITQTSTIDLGSLTTSKQDALRLRPWGTSPNQTGELRFEERSGGHYVGLRAPDSIANNIIWTLPVADGSANEVLMTDGAGVLRWGNPTGGGDLMSNLNLSDLGNVAAARQNLGLGTLALRDAISSAEISDGVIVDADISSTANIATSKLSGPVTAIASHGLGSLATLSVIADSNVASGAAIATSKLSGPVTAIASHGLGSLATLSTIADSQVASGAAIATSKLSGPVTAIASNGLGSLASLNAITDTNIIANANISDSKLATIASAGKVSGAAIITGTITGDAAFHGSGGIDTTGSVVTSSTVDAAGVRTSGQAGYIVGPFDTTAGSTGELRMLELAAGGTNYVGFKAPDAISTNLIWTLPESAGTAGQVLSTSASGMLSWTTPSNGSITAVVAGAGLSGGGSSGSVTLNVDVGTTGGKIVKLDANAQLPAVDGSALTNVNAAQLQGQAVSLLTPAFGQVLKWDGQAWAPGQDDGGVAGAINGASNLGSSSAATADVFESIAASSMRFRRLKEGPGIDLNQNADDVTLSLADNGVSSTKILNATVLTEDLADAAVNSAKLLNGSIVTEDLADDAVNSAKILNGTIADADIASAANIADSKLATIATAGKVSGAAITSGTLGGSSGFAGTGGVNLQSAGATGTDLRFFSNNNTNYLAFRAPNGVTNNTTWTLPGGDGGAGHVLSTAGNGTLSWMAIPAAPVSSVAGKTGVVTLNADDVAATANKLWLSSTDKTKLDGITAGANMLKSTYDTNANNKVDSADNADQFGGQAASYYTNASNLASGTVAYARLPVGTAANTVAAGDDARLSNARTPTGAAGGDLSGSYPNPTLKSSATIDADRAVGSDHIKTGAVTTAKLAADAVDSSKILNGTIADADIANNAAIADSKLASITTAGKVSGAAITSGTIGGSTAVNTTGAITTTSNLVVNGTMAGKKLDLVASWEAAGVPNLNVYKSWYDGDSWGGGPAGTGTAQTNGIVRFRKNDGDADTSLDFGTYWWGQGSWIQNSSSGDLSVTRPLYLNPNGGRVGVATAGSNNFPFWAPNAAFWVGGNVMISQVWTDQAAPTNGLAVEGSVGIGTPTPANKLSVSGSADVSGNVGIGTTAPAAKLDVNGTVKLGTAGRAFASMGACSLASTTFTNSASTATCTGIPAGAAVSCSGSAAYSSNGVTLYCRASAVNTVACTTSNSNTTAMTYACMWVVP